MPKIFGPFSEAESTVRAHKVSGSADFDAAASLMSRIEAQPPVLTELYLLGTPESYNRLEQIIASTDHSAQPLILAMTSWYVTAAYTTNQIINGATRTRVSLSVANSPDTSNSVRIWRVWGISIQQEICSPRLSCIENKNYQ